MPRCIKRITAALFAVISLMLCLCTTYMPSVSHQCTAYADTEVECTEDEPPDNCYQDPRNVSVKKEGHLFKGYWSEYFATMKSLVFHPKATLAPAKKPIRVFFIFCICFIIFSILLSIPQIPVIFVYRDRHEEYGRIPLIKNFHKFVLKFIAVILLISPIVFDADYIRAFSNYSLISAILLALLFCGIRVVLGLTAGVIVFAAVSAALKKFTEDIASMIGLIPFTAVFLLFCFIPYVMQIWNDYGDKAPLLK